MVSVKRGEKIGQFRGVDTFSMYVGLFPPDTWSKRGLRSPPRAPLSR